MTPFRLGVVVNPWAGIGGATALKGSDGSAVRAEALARGAEPNRGASAALGNKFRIFWIHCQGNIIRASIDRVTDIRNPNRPVAQNISADGFGNLSYGIGHMSLRVSCGQDYPLMDPMTTPALTSALNIFASRP